jgi:hypothetical protein
MLTALTALAIDGIVPRQSERSRHHPRSVSVGRRADFNEKPAITLYPSRLSLRAERASLGLRQRSAARLCCDSAGQGLQDPQRTDPVDGDDRDAQGGR